MSKPARSCELNEKTGCYDVVYHDGTHESISADEVAKNPICVMSAKELLLEHIEKQEEEIKRLRRENEFLRNCTDQRIEYLEKLLMETGICSLCGGILPDELRNGDILNGPPICYECVEEDKEE